MTAAVGQKQPTDEDRFQAAASRPSRLRVFIATVPKEAVSVGKATKH
jgi:hypothetical protein